ncbi:MAG: hypothetical protein EBR82_34010 [Caulobacteraceae bacterium]|nr:hypothetical protein [Caulobacteraceae bacterium]
MNADDPLEDLALTRVVSVTLDADEQLTIDHEGVSYYETTGMLLHALLLHIGVLDTDDEDDD